MTSAGFWVPPPTETESLSIRPCRDRKRRVRSLRPARPSRSGLAAPAGRSTRPPRPRRPARSVGTGRQCVLPAHPASVRSRDRPAMLRRAKDPIPGPVWAHPADLGPLAQAGWPRGTRPRPRGAELHAATPAAPIVSGGQRRQSSFVLPPPVGPSSSCPPALILASRTGAWDGNLDLGARVESGPIGRSALAPPTRRGSGRRADSSSSGAA
jgi:hypothetical protein